MDMKDQRVPNRLRFWFVVHFAVDLLIGVPLLLIPEMIMPRIGWSPVDPVTSRLVGAALLGIGIESLLGRNEGYEVFVAMLNLKILWASAAVMGITLGIVNDGPPIAWVFNLIFAGFLALWVGYRIQLSRLPQKVE
jgi:hypothetical protein